MKNLIIAIMVLATQAFAVATLYDVELSFNDNFDASEVAQTFVATADSIFEVSFFCGRKIIPRWYEFQLKDADENPISVWTKSDSAGLYEYALVKATFNPPVCVRKGFTYRLHIRHALPEQYSTNFYYNRDNPYPYGQLVGQPSNYDLAARIIGVNNFPQDLFGMNAYLTFTHSDPTHADTIFWDSTSWKACMGSMKQIGITWDRVGQHAWQHFQPDSGDPIFRSEWCDSLLQFYADSSINVLWLFSWSTYWSCCDSMFKLRGWYEPFPVNLFEPVFDTSGNINPDNYFAQYVHKFVKRYGPGGVYWANNGSRADNPVLYYEMWNEPNGAVYNRKWWSTDSVKDPVYDSLITAMGEEASLMYVYSRLCKVGDLAAREAAGNDTIYTIVYVPNNHMNNDEWPTIKEWLDTLQSDTVDAYCDGLSHHVYAYPMWDDSVRFHDRQKLALDSIWKYIKVSDFKDKFLWCTEYSTANYSWPPQNKEDPLDSTDAFPIMTDEQLATLCTFMANDNPRGPLDCSFLWIYTYLYFRDKHTGGCRYYCITDSTIGRRPMGFGYQQLTSKLKDYQFNGSLVSPEDTLLYDSIRVYEFENPQTNRRMYTAWKNRPFAGSRTFELPLRTNAGKVDSVAKDNSPGEDTVSCSILGFATVSLDTIPIYISEPLDSVLRRPDLVIDSVWTVPAYPRDGDSVLVYAMLRNIDTVTATPDTMIFVSFYYNDTLIGTDTIYDEIKPESTLVSSPDDTVVAAQGLHLGKAVANADSTGTRLFVEQDFSNNACYRLYDTPLRPYGSIKINKDSTYSNLPYVALNLSSTNPNDTLNPPADSMQIWQTGGDSIGWKPFDTTHCFQLHEQESGGAITVYVQYKVGKNNDSHIYSDSIVYDKTAPTASFVINDDDKFTNSKSVILKNSLTAADTAEAKMRFGNKELVNVVKNSSFDTTSHWYYNTATHDDSLDLFEIPVYTSGADTFYQKILPDSLDAYDNDTLLMWIDLVSDNFTGTGKVKFLYFYHDPVEEEITSSCSDSIVIPEGTKAHVSHYNLSLEFKYHPTLGGGSVFDSTWVGVFVDNDASVDSARLYIDNFRLDVVGPSDDYTRFGDYDTLESWTLLSGEGTKKVYGQFSDGAGNETSVVFDTIIVDTTKPIGVIHSPQDSQWISDTIFTCGQAYDTLNSDSAQHFKQYELRYKKIDSTTWYWCRPDSIGYIPFPPPFSGGLGQWDTWEVTDNHGNGWYHLSLTVVDSAGNEGYDTVVVKVFNQSEPPKGGFSGFSNHLYGLAAGEEVFIGEFGTGKIYRYDTTYQLIDTFTLNDSVGVGFPLAMALDDSNKLWIANITSHLINRFTPQGNLLTRFAGGFSKPSGIAFDNSGNIWITDRLHHKIKKFNKEGTKLFEFGTQGDADGEIDRPIGIAFHNDRLYIADSRNKRVSVFDTLGDFASLIGDSMLFQMPFGLIVDSTGCLFVSDFLSNQVIEFDPYGNRLFTIDTLLDAPSGLALSPNINDLYVSDTKNKQVLAFAVRGGQGDGGGGQSYGDVYIGELMYAVYPTLFSKALTIRLQCMIGKKLTLKIYDVTGRVVKTILEDHLIKTDHTIVWDGRDDQKRKLACGVYFIRLESSDYKDRKKAVMLK